jgi:hypothetical protein
LKYPWGEDGRAANDRFMKSDGRRKDSKGGLLKKDER